jgi:ubiquinone/menaquinone biosynthesis C-methylase UbiE
MKPAAPKHWLADAYDRHVFPRLLDWSMASRHLHAPRNRTLASARGRILEIGFGTGRNLPHYPPHVRRIEALDPEVAFDRYVRPRLDHAVVEVEFQHLDAARLPYAADSFDTVVSTLTLCSIPDVAGALDEIHRVLKRGGRLLFLEHGLAPDPGVQRWQRRLEPLQQKLAGGCHLTRDASQLVTNAGLRIERADQYYLRPFPRCFAYFTEGAALKA